MSEWAKPYERDNWGHKTTHYGETAKTASGTHATDPAVPKIEPGEVEVRWPDGTVEVVIVEAARHVSRVYDMGHEYTVETERLFMLLDHHGATFQVPLVGSGALVRQAEVEEVRE